MCLNYLNERQRYEIGRRRRRKGGEEGGKDHYQHIIFVINRKCTLFISRYSRCYSRDEANVQHLHPNPESWNEAKSSETERWIVTRFVKQKHLFRWSTMGRPDEEGEKWGRGTTRNQPNSQNHFWMAPRRSLPGEHLLNILNPPIYGY